MLKIQIKPISHWTGAETKEPRRSQFKQTYSNTKKILETELDKLNALESSVKLEMFIRSEDLRNDGELRANAKPYRQGIVLSCTTSVPSWNRQSQKCERKINNLTYPCDAFDDWRDNLRAVALSLEALRKVERYGVFKYQDIISRLSLPGQKSDRQEAAEFIARYSDYSPSALGNPEVLVKAVQQARIRLHPDKVSGDHELFVKLENAYNLLK